MPLIIGRLLIVFTFLAVMAPVQAEEYRQEEIIAHYVYRLANDQYNR